MGNPVFLLYIFFGEKLIFRCFFCFLRPVFGRCRLDQPSPWSIFWTCCRIVCQAWGHLQHHAGGGEGPGRLAGQAGKVTGWMEMVDLQENIVRTFQASADLDSTLQSMKENMDKLLELFMDANEKMKNNNNRWIVWKTLLWFWLTVFLGYYKACWSCFLMSLRNLVRKLRRQLLKRKKENHQGSKKIITAKW